MSLYHFINLINPLKNIKRNLQMFVMTNPWVEKYRPSTLENVVLSDINKRIIDNIIEDNYFPNLLLYGPPGTGKTTTIINLLNAYQKRHNQENKELIIHLNASDDRGIDIIRNQIQQFISTKNMFNKGLKFVVLDEVDYMTKAAQQALRHLMQTYKLNIRFCLICNYISKIDENLQNEFLRLRFNELPKDDVIKFLKNIIDNEKLDISLEKIQQIQDFYRSDIRSMINFIQSNQSNINIVTSNVWNKLLIIKEKKEIIKYIHDISISYDIEIKNVIKDFLNFLIINKISTSEFLDFVENIIHSDVKSVYMVNYFADNINKFINI
jgi:replication factor C subunit 3/5